jgi:L-ribulose-5-phosphate 3-epimerase
MKITPELIALGMYEKALPQSLSWAERLSAAREANYNFVEISIDDSDERIKRLSWDLPTRMALRNEIQGSGMQIKSMSLSAHRRFPLGSENKKIRSQAQDIFKRAVDFSVDLGIRYILVAGSDVYHEPSNPKTMAYFLEGLEEGYLHAAQAGVILALENWDIRVESIKKVMDYVHYFDSPWFQAYADVGNLVFAGKDVLAELEYAKGHLAAVHVKDTHRDQLRYVTPGEGAVPFTQVFSKLAELGFMGSIVLELWTAEQPNAMEIVKKSNLWIRERMKEGWLAYERTQMNLQEIK